MLIKIQNKRELGTIGFLSHQTLTLCRKRGLTVARIDKGASVRSANELDLESMSYWYHTKFDITYFNPQTSNAFSMT